MKFPAAILTFPIVYNTSSVHFHAYDVKKHKETTLHPYLLTTIIKKYIKRINNMHLNSSIEPSTLYETDTFLLHTNTF